MIDLIHEILDVIEKAPTKKDKNSMINAYIDKYHNLGILLNYMYQDNEFDVVIPEYKPNNAPAGSTELMLITEIRKLYIFLKSSKLNAKRKQELLLQMLEGLHPQEAAILANLIIGKLKIKGYTKVNWEEFVQIKRGLIADKETKARIPKPLIRRQAIDI